MTVFEIVGTFVLLIIFGCILGGITGWHISRNKKEFQELHDASARLFEVVAKELRIKELVEWLEKRLKGEGCE